MEVKKIENYRGITLLSIVGKAFVSILNERLTRWMEKVGTVVEEQAGFRAGYSSGPGICVIRDHTEAEAEEEAITVKPR